MHVQSVQNLNTVFHCQICKFVGFLLPSSSWLLKLPIYIILSLVLKGIVGFISCSRGIIWQPVVIG